MLGVFLTSFLSNSAVAPISSGLVFIYAGMTISVMQNKVKK